MLTQLMRTLSRLQIYWLCLHVRMWNAPHYRSGTWRGDMRKNLRNVALPGTGAPLSLLCHSRLVAVSFLWLGVPLIALVAALISRVGDSGGDSGGDGEADHSGDRDAACDAARDAARDAAPPLHALFTRMLFTPRDWFSYWRLNCALASYHAQRTADTGYAMEDKLEFLEACEANGVAATSYLVLPKLVVKHRNEEGGLGLHLYANATAGGDWILQQGLSNAPELARLLPPDAPLSTIRIVSASGGSRAHSDAAQIVIVSGCLRAGRAGAATDHSCVMFDLDLSTGRLGMGTTNAHWYQLGLFKAFGGPWRSKGHTVAAHPDTGVRIEARLTPIVVPTCHGSFAFAIYVTSHNFPYGSSPCILFPI
tara:strand:- start:1349 stop:2446 length:1098 start_codon:yes stop_codon:yes gene_type:complete